GWSSASAPRGSGSSRSRGRGRGSRVWAEAAAPATPGRDLRPDLLSGVLGFLAALLEVSLALVGLALGLEPLLAGHLPGSLFDLSLGLFTGVLGLLVGCHRGTPLRLGGVGAAPTPWSAPLRPNTTTRCGELLGCGVPERCTGRGPAATSARG